MNYKIDTIAHFDKQFKRLAKKYPSLKTDFIQFVESVKSNPFQGVSLKNNCHKLRLAIKSKGKRKSGGARVILHIVVQNKMIYFLSIYDKSESENIGDKEISQLLAQISNFDQ